MNPVQEIKQRHDMDILLRASAPAARKRQEARRRREMGKSRINAALARRGHPLPCGMRGAVYRLCRRCKQRWNVSALEPGGKVYLCPRCERGWGYGEDQRGQGADRREEAVGRRAL